VQPDDILRFWFEETAARQHWMADPQFDAVIRRRFEPIHQAAGRGELYRWRATPDGRLAEVIVLDQFARNIYRDTAAAFVTDPVALVLAQEAVALGANGALAPARRAFLYLPFMHSESLLVHDQAAALFAEPGLEATRDYERMHRGILERFGRYPHRNRALGRSSTPAEIEFLRQPGSSF
jgi:uncharacterized protein (DUF924 family)